MPSETKAWMVRHGRMGEHEDLALETGRAVLGWQGVGSLKGRRSKDSIRKIVADSDPDLNSHQIGQSTGQLFAFAVEMSENDVIVLPMKSATDQIRVGRVRGPYEYVSLRDDESGARRHSRLVEWNPEPLDRANVSADLQLSLKSMRTVCKLSKFDGFRRWSRIADGTVETPEVEVDDELDLDVVAVARQQIRDHVAAAFEGVRMERLVGEILRAEGYTVQQGPGTADGGVDVMAGSGKLGFQSPRIVVQVKAWKDRADATPIRELEGVRERFGADQCLLICWGGFKPTTRAEARQSYFTMRLWDADDVIDAIFRNYERLPLDIRDAIPLQQMWALDLNSGQE